ncbi:unnamed protein product [Cunninghamella blakesleeana]
MPLGASQRKLSFNNNHSNNNNGHRHLLVERCSTLRACESCKRKKRVCNGQRPCSHCSDSKECIYSVVSDHARGVFTTSTARRLSSGSACETCRRRKTKCDGGSPCGYCAANQIDCINNSERRKRSLANIHQYQSSLSSSFSSNNNNNNNNINNHKNKINKNNKNNNSNNNNNSNTTSSSSSSNTIINNQPLLSSPLSLSSSTSTINMKPKNNKNNKKLQLSSSTTTTTSTMASPSSTLSLSITSPTSLSSSSTASSTVITPSSASFLQTNIEGNQTMDRIEDRLSRIEKLMKAFSPTHSLSQTSSYQDMLLQQSSSTSTAIRKMSSPVHSTFQKQQFHHVRPHRHSVQGITVAKEKAELKSVLNQNHPTYPTPPNSKSSSSSLSAHPNQLLSTSSSSSSSSTLDTTTTMHNNQSNKLTNSMLNLTLSPSSSTSSTTNMPPSSTTPLIYQSQPYYQKDILNRSPSPEGDWKSPIPSLMDQLSQRTFHSNAMEYTVQYPIYPLTPPPPNSRDQ